MVADCGKKSKISEEDSYHIDTELVLSIEKLQEIQDELEKVNEQASEEVLKIDQQYNEIRRLVYEKRSGIIASIPDFWLTAFLTHPALCDLLSEEDYKIFKFLDSLDVEDFKGVTSGYSITFKFKPNPFFKDTKLVKTYTFLDEGTTEITGTTIKWKGGMGAANGNNPERKGNKRPPSEVSFFDWFTETQLKGIADGFNDEVADIIKEDLWPNPMKYIDNIADEEDSDGDDEGEEEDEEEGNSSDDEEDDEE